MTEREYGKLGAALIESLQQAVEWTRGERTDLRVDVLHGPVGTGDPVEGPPAFFGFQIADIRERLGLSRELFGRLFGVSAGSVRAWETGRREPSPAACRLLQIACLHPELVRDVLFMSEEEIGAMDTAPPVPTRIERTPNHRAAADTQG